MSFETRLISPLEKVFPSDPLKAKIYDETTVLHGEPVSFQLAVKADDLKLGVKIEIDSPISAHIQVGIVELVASMMPNYKNHDDYLLKTTPGLYPDPIVTKDAYGLVHEQWNGFWVYVQTKGVKPNDYPIKLKVIHEETVVAVEEFTLRVLDIPVKFHGIKRTEWFYLDCIADLHRVDMLSDAHFELIEKYVENYVEHGGNMILTPLFSPPLEMFVGGQRPTVQLVEIRKFVDTYHYNFELLERFMDLCLAKGVLYFEMNHLFSQWGAEYAPKIFAWVDGSYEQLFGWHTRADRDLYKDFLASFLHALQQFLQEKNWEHLCHFHISDEPNSSNIHHYETAKNIIRNAGLQAPIFDALSEFDFYQRGLVEVPVASTNHIDVFVKNQVPDLWAYYCCMEHHSYLSNRFLNMSGLRTRIIGLQLYVAGISGFLHWGYNHWYGHKCLNQQLNPYHNTDADRGFPSGDAFLVYPGEKGPVSSIRLKQLQLAFSDIGLCKTLEEKIGREGVLEMIHSHGVIDFKHYPQSDDWFLDLRKGLIHALGESI